MKVGVSVIDNFYVYEVLDLEKIREKIIERCTKHRARAYINLNRLDIEKIAMYSIKQSVDYVLQKDFKVVKNSYATACGSHHSEKSKRWVIDIDAEVLHRKDEIRLIIQNLHDEITKTKYSILAEISTKSGVHIISNPFNMEKFRQILEQRMENADDPIIKIDVHRNSPTVLYIADNVEETICPCCGSLK